ncbi:MAG: Na+/H+ antiporter NhaC family protein [Cytophagales bacterium]|nr:Na+/H+ antiporter NhaC family protein [Cytophagales bacterium]
MNSKFPHTLLIIVCFILMAGAATYFIPKGAYERTNDPSTDREVVVPGSYHIIEANPLSPFEILVGIPRGIVKAGEIIVLILLVGASFYVVEKTGALKAGVVYMTSRLKGREELALVVTGLFFLIGGALEGMEEEVIPLIPVMVLLTRRMGYDVMVMVCISYGSAVLGASFSPINPFGAITAQKVAEVPFLTGAGFQVGIMAMAFVLWMTMVIRYGRRNRLEKKEDENDVSEALTKRTKLILVIVGGAFLMLIYGLLSLGWGFNEMSAEFFLVGMTVGVIGRLGVNGTCVTYVEGLREMTYAALIVGFAHGISLVMIDGNILDTIIYSLFIPMESLPPAVSLIGMMGAQSILHVVIPSYAGQAALTMPILAPLSDLIGLSRQVCVMAFQYGAILVNLISPTNGALMAILALSGIAYDRWFLFVAKRLLAVMGFGAAALLMANVLAI